MTIDIVNAEQKIILILRQELHVIFVWFKYPYLELDFWIQSLTSKENMHFRLKSV